MTKREYRYITKIKGEKFWRRIANVSGSYILTCLKIKQLKAKTLPPSAQLEIHLKYTESEIERLISE